MVCVYLSEGLLRLFFSPMLLRSVLWFLRASSQTPIPPPEGLPPPPTFPSKDPAAPHNEEASPHCRERDTHNVFILIFRTAHQWWLCVCVLPSAAAGLSAVVCAFFQSPAGHPGGWGACSAFPAQGWVLRSSSTRSLRNPGVESAGATSSANPAAGKKKNQDTKKEMEWEREKYTNN